MKKTITILLSLIFIALAAYDVDFYTVCQNDTLSGAVADTISLNIWLARSSGVLAFAYIDTIGAAKVAMTVTLQTSLDGEQWNTLGTIFGDSIVIETKALCIDSLFKYWEDETTAVYIKLSEPFNVGLTKYSRLILTNVDAVNKGIANIFLGVKR